MFFRHFSDCDRHGQGEFGRGRFFGRHMHGGGFGRREGRMFDGGELRLVILALVAEKPRYGYEIIKELGERPSASPTKSGHCTTAWRTGLRSVTRVTARTLNIGNRGQVRSSRKSRFGQYLHASYFTLEA